MRLLKRVPMVVSYKGVLYPLSIEGQRKFVIFSHGVLQSVLVYFIFSVKYIHILSYTSNFKPIFTERAFSKK